MSCAKSLEELPTIAPGMVISKKVNNTDKPDRNELTSENCGDDAKEDEMELFSD